MYPLIKHILIADDDEDDRMLFSDALQQVSSAVELSVATDGDELLERLRTAKQLPDVIFLDLNMPAKNGVESLQEIKKDPELRQLPVIIFTTTANHHTVDRMFALGARYYIEKPTDFNVLKQLIQTLLVAGLGGPPQSKKEFIKYLNDQ